MAKYTSGRQINLKVGVSSYSENLTSVEVIGKVGIGTTTATSKLSVEGDAYFSGIVTANILISSVYGEFTGGAISGTSIAGIALSISGISTFTNGPVLIGSGTSTGIESQKLQVTGDAYVSNVTSTNSLSIGSTQVISSSRQLRNIASLDATTTATIESAIANAPNTFTDLNVTGISTLGVTSATNLTAQQLNVSGISTFQSSNLKIRNPANTFEYSILGSAIVADRTLTIPLVGAADTIAVLNTAQTFTAAQTFTSTLTLSGSNTGSHVFGSNQTSATITLGGTGGTGGITLGRSTASQTLNIATGVSGVGTTKTINFGTAGATGSFTQINIGPNSGIGTILIGTGTRLGIGSAVPRAALDVAGDGRVSGVVTAITFIGAFTGTATTAINVIGGAGSITQLQVTGISTFIDGPVFIGSGTSTGTASQRLQVTGGAYISGSIGIGTTNPTSKLQVEGDVFVSGIITSTDFNSASDINLKKNIKPFENALDKVIQINGVTFEWKKTNSQSAGIIAQDVEKVFPELVRDGNFKTVNYNGLIGVLVESIKELKQEIEELKRKINN
jgi:hypothetical protein